MAKKIDQATVIFNMGLDHTESISWLADFERGSPDDAPDSDSAEVTGIPLHQRREILKTPSPDEVANLTDFERRWRALTLSAEEWGWLNGSVRTTSKKHHVPVVISWDIQEYAWEARAALTSRRPGGDDEMQVHPVGTVTVNGDTYPVYKSITENTMFPALLEKLPMFSGSFRSS